MENRTSKMRAGNSAGAIQWLLAAVLFGILIGIWACLWVSPLP
jgi:hypothetical protein